MYVYNERSQMNTPLKYIYTHTQVKNSNNKIVTNTVVTITLCDHFSFSPHFLILSEDIVSARSHCEALIPVFDLGLDFFQGTSFILK